MNESGATRLLPAIFCAVIAAPCGAQSVGDAWRYSGTLYLWGAGINGETAHGAEMDVSFDTLISNLNMTFMGTFEAARGPWSVLADVIYLNVGANDSATVPVRSGGVVNVDASVETKGWVLNLLGAYNVVSNQQTSLDLVAGARYLDLELDFDLGLAAGRYGVARGLSEKQSSWDGVVGVKGRVNLNERWYLPYYADIGAGQSDLTWQVFGGVGYSFNWGDVSLVYRKITWDFGSSEKLDNINFSGPVLSATWHF